MKIRSMRVTNYKCFSDSGTVLLEPDFNVIVGKNNSGKSALLESLRFRERDEKPYQGIDHPKGLPVNPDGVIDLEISVDMAGFRRYLLSVGKRFQIAAPAYAANADGWLREFFADGFRKVEFSLARTGMLSVARPFFELQGLPERLLTVDVRTDRQAFHCAGNAQFTSSSGESIGDLVADYCAESIYVFRAERLGLARASVLPTRRLAGNASDLAAALQTFQNESPGRFRTLINKMRQVFPNVFDVTVPPDPSAPGCVVIKVWSADSASAPASLSFDLTDCGTGVGQVLAILYVVISTDVSNVICVDEPNSFLHPGAAKKLMNILRSSPQHQYIIATHSTEVISTFREASMHLVQWTSSGSEIKNLPKKNNEVLRLVLDEVGVSLADVFAAEAIIWVEGATERDCFRLIASHFQVGVLEAASLLVLRNTGDLGSRRSTAEGIWEIYSKLSEANALIPPRVAFNLDLEERSRKDVEDLKRMSNGRVKFLPRRTYENYLLNSGAMAYLLNEVLSGDGRKFIEVSAVADWLENKRLATAYKATSDAVVSQGDWRTSIDAPRLLADFVNELTESTFSFSKVPHSAKLTEWLLINNPEELQEVADYLGSIFD